MDKNNKDTVEKRSKAVQNISRAIGIKNSVDNNKSKVAKVPIKKTISREAYQKAYLQAKYKQYADKLLAGGYSQQQVAQILNQNTQLSQNTQAMLARMRFVQNKAILDDMNMQRILRERKILSSHGELLKAPNMFQAIPGQMEGWLERPETNPLRAPNVFQEDRNKNPSIMDTQGRPTILQSVMRLNLFGDSINSESKSPKPTRLKFF